MLAAPNEGNESTTPTPVAETPKAIHTHTATSAETNDPDFVLAQQYESSGNTALAIASYRKFIKNHPASAIAPDAQFRIAQLEENLGKYKSAFDTYQILVTRYPDTPNFEKAVSAQILIANKFLNGMSVKVLGFSVVSSLDDAQKMFAAILKNAPYSKNAPVAQFNLGLTYSKDPN